MADKTIREYSRDPLVFTLTRDEAPYDVDGKFFKVVIADALGTPQSWNITTHTNLFEVDVNEITFIPPEDAFRAELTDYEAFIWVLDGQLPLSFPADDVWTIQVLSAFGVGPRI